MSEQKTVAIIDHIGRTVFGKLVSENDTTLTLNNPVIVHVQPDQQGNIQVQNFPFIFFEFLDKERRSSNEWTFNKASIVTSNVTLSPKVVENYDQINKPQEPVAKNPKVIEINDI